jgi:hypothetical protein
MDMFDGVGRRRDRKSGQLVSIGQNTLNGYEHNCLFRNNADGTFTDVAHTNAAGRQEDGRGLSVLDYDRDGRLDIVMRNYRQPAQVLHNTGAGGHWLQLKLVGTRSNRDAVGARIDLTASPGRGLRQSRRVSLGAGYLSASSLVQHFGLGEARTVDVSVHWPSGTVTELAGVSADQRLMLREDRAEAVAVERWLYPDDPAMAAGG